MGRKVVGGFCAAVLLLMAAAATRAEDAAYEVRFHRAEKVGQKFDVTSTVDLTRKMQAQVDGQPANPREDQGKAEFAGTLEVKAVDAQSRSTEFHLVVKKLRGSEGGAALSDVAPAGTEIDVAYKDGKTQFTQKEGTLSADAKKALDLLFHPYTSDKTDDDMFGTMGKKKVGDSWKPNFKAMAEDLSHGSMQMDPDKMTGTIKLAGLTTLGGAPALDVQATIESTDVSLPAPMGKAKEAKVAMQFSGPLPVDAANSSSAAQMTMKVHGVFEMTQGGKTATVTVDVNMSHDESRLLMK